MTRCYTDGLNIKPTGMNLHDTGKTLMQITQKHKGEIYIFSLAGRFDIQSAPEVEEKLNLAMSQGARRLLVDLDGTEYMSGAGLKVLLEIEEKLKKEGGKIRLCRLRSYAKEVFDAVQFGEILETHTSIEKAIGSF